MKLPTTYDDDFLGHDRQFPHEGPLAPSVYSLVFPPIGFFPFYGIGNGDYHGYYWPVGREDGPPLVAFSSHDVGSLIPEHSDIAAFYRCQRARTEDGDESIESYRQLVAIAIGQEPTEHNIRGVSPNDYEALLSLDPTSAYYLCAAADADAAEGKMDSAEHRYQQSLKQLPNYVAAHFGLAVTLRRQRRGREATVHLRETLLGPMALYGGSFWGDTALPGSFRNDWCRKALMWLQESREVEASLAEDPFTKRVPSLTFKTGAATNPDIDILRAVVDEYVALEAFSDAARVWQLVGDLASYETTSFRERIKLNPAAYGTRLAELLERSGNVLRAALVRNMLAQMGKPEGLYL